MVTNPRLIKAAEKLGYAVGMAAGRIVGSVSKTTSPSPGLSDGPFSDLMRGSDVPDAALPATAAAGSATGAAPYRLSFEDKPGRREDAPIASLSGEAILHCEKGRHLDGWGLEDEDLIPALEHVRSEWHRYVETKSLAVLDRCAASAVPVLKATLWKFEMFPEAWHGLVQGSIQAVALSAAIDLDMTHVAKNHDARDEMFLAYAATIAAGFQEVALGGDGSLDRVWFDPDISTLLNMLRSIWTVR